MKADLRLTPFTGFSRVVGFFLPVVLAATFFAFAASAQTVDEIIAKNVQAHGGADKLKSVRSLRTTAKFSQGSFRADLRQENKRADKVYYWHTGYPGGIKERTAEKILDGKHPERVLHKAVERMVPRGPLGRQQMKNLRIYTGAKHPHEAQSPITVDVAALNTKNARSA